MVQILKGHLSPMTAYTVDDYPYGFRLRCHIRYWLEHDTRHGVRLVSQTSNPKKGNAWNKPKASTYARFGGCMFLDGAGHVHWTGAHEYMGAEELQGWCESWREGVPPSALELLDRFLAAKLAYAANRKQDDPLNVGLNEARAAFVAPIKKDEAP